MKLSQALQEFYIANNLPKEGGVEEDWFYLDFKWFRIKLPNSAFRKKLIHIHDTQHVLYNCDVTWKGEAFIAGWEVATGMWKHLPIGMMSVWAMGYSLLRHPKEVWKGYSAGLSCIGLIDLKISKEALLNMSITEVRQQIQKQTPTTFYWSIFLWWCFWSLIVVFFPFLLGVWIAIYGI